MSIIEMIRLILGTVFIAIGLIVFFIEVIGIFRQKYVLNRMHAAAMGDTMGLFFVMLGLMIFQGFDFVTIKFVMIIILFWLTSPVTSHMTALLETYTNERLGEHLTYEGDLEILEKQLENEAK